MWPTNAVQEGVSRAQRQPAELGAHPGHQRHIMSVPRFLTRLQTPFTPPSVERSNPEHVTIRISPTSFGYMVELNSSPSDLPNAHVAVGVDDSETRCISVVALPRVTHLTAPRLTHVLDFGHPKPRIDSRRSMRVQKHPPHTYLAPF